MLNHIANHVRGVGRARRGLVMGLSLLPVFAAVHFVSYWLRFDTFTERRWTQITCTLLTVLVIKTIIFTQYRIYQGWSRYATFYDLVKLTQAATVSAVCLAVFDYLFLSGLKTPRTVFFMDWGGTIVTVGGLRFLRRLLNEGWRSLDRSGTVALIVGADEFGEAILRSIRTGGKLNYNVVGFVATDEFLKGTCIGGVPVLGTIDEIRDLMKSSEASEVLIASSGLSGKEVRQLVDESRVHGFSVKILPSYDQILDGKVDLRPRTVSIADLLRREPVQLDSQNLHRWLEGETLMVTGAAGSIGSEICRQLLQFNPGKLVLVDRSENGQFFLEKSLRSEYPDADLELCIADIGERSRMADLFREHSPNIVFHAAAYKHVPLMELNCSEAIKNIPMATKNLADLADDHGVESFVMISTDKAVNPTSVMGCCKRVAELYVQALAESSQCRFVTVRFGNVLGSNGSVVPIFRSQIAAGGPVTVTHPDMQRYFMMIPEASQLVIQAGAMGNGGEVFVLDMGEPVKIVDLAKDMIRLSGLRVDDDIEIQFSGVRPGEKLFEELHIHGEQHLATSHPKIMVARCQVSSLDHINRALQRLQFAARRTPEDVVDELQQIVPEFVPTRFGQPGEIPGPAAIRTRKAA